MKIWFAANIPEDSYGGVSRSMRELVAHLKKSGHDLRIIYSSRFAKGNFLIFSFQLLAQFAASARFLPDCLIARSADGVLCAVASRLFGLKTRTIIHNHGWEEHVYEYERRLPRHIVTSPTTWKAKIIRFPLLRLALKLCSCCISGTLDEIRWLRHAYPGSDTRLFYAPNGVTARASAYWPGQPRMPLNFLHIGPPTWKKNMQYSAAVFAAVHASAPEARLFLVGTGTHDLSPFLAGSGCDAGAIVNVPRTAPGDMESWYTKCPYLLAFSRYEGGHSFAVLEALSYGIIVCASSIPSNREIVRTGRNGLLLSGTDAQEDSKAILGIISHAELNVAVRLRAHKTSLRNAWKRQARRLEKLLCSMI